jgi:hypothetical protein
LTRVNIAQFDLVKGSFEGQAGGMGGREAPAVRGEGPLPPCGAGAGGEHDNRSPAGCRMLRDSQLHQRVPGVRATGANDSRTASATAASDATVGQLPGIGREALEPGGPLPLRGLSVREPLRKPPIRPCACQYSPVYDIDDLRLGGNSRSRALAPLVSYAARPP